MDESVLEALNNLFDKKLKPILDGQDKINSRLDRIEKKLDAVYQQTADLTKFRTEMKESELKQILN